VSLAPTGKADLGLELAPINSPTRKALTLSYRHDLGRDDPFSIYTVAQLLSGTTPLDSMPGDSGGREWIYV
jgi:hypothetical protein